MIRIVPPQNPKAEQARQEMINYAAGLSFDYRLTWPATSPGVITYADQWRYDEAGDIEAWYTAAQLKAIEEMLKATMKGRGQ